MSPDEPVDQPAGQLVQPAEQLDRPAEQIDPPPASTAPPSGPSSTGPLRVLSIIVIVLGGLLMVAGTITWFVVRDQLADEQIVVSEDAPFLGGDEVDGPFSAYAEAEAIEDHALEASGGLTYAQLDREDPTRETVMTASFLRASLFTSVVSFGVAFFAFGVGLIFILIGWALLRVDRSLRAHDAVHGVR